MKNLYPLKFTPILKEKIWGGKKLKDILGKNIGNKCNIGESWELSGVEEDESIVANGFLKGNSINELIEIYMGDLVGEKVYKKFGNQFPLLIKFIDASRDLSIQVHPNNEIALERHNSYGKTEMWYVMQADTDARLVAGFKDEVTCQSYVEHVENNKLDELLGYTKVEPGDVFYIPAGRVHSIGAGILLAEIQQTSDITYRIYDYDRVDKDGEKRELHTDEALDVINYLKLDEPKKKYLIKENNFSEVVKCDYFTTNIIELTNTIEKDYYKIESFVIYICLEGAFEVEMFNSEKTIVLMGETILVPAECSSVIITPKEKSKFLEIYIED